MALASGFLSFLRSFRWALLLLAAASIPLFADTPLLRVAVTETELIFTWPPTNGGEILLRKLPLHTNAGVANATISGESAAETVWRGEGAAGRAALPRITENGADQMFSGWELARAEDAKPLWPCQFASDFQGLQRRTSAGDHIASKKGLACVLDPNDATALGIRQVNQNIGIDGLLDLQSAEPKMSFQYEGRRIGLRPAAVQRLDADLRTALQSAQRVTGILLNHVTPKTPKGSLLVHPLSDPATVPIGPAAFNTATAEGVFFYRAILHWLIERYTREDGEFGRLSGLVIGNEMQSHWSWYHLGPADPDLVIREYSRALRIADLVSRSLHADFPVYVSLDHHWALSASEDPLHGFSGLEAVEKINGIARAGGDFPWNLAFHPYPENLLDPRFWRDRSAPLRFDAPRITFHNLEVLPAFLAQQDYLHEGKSRRIALTEQGFHCPEGEDGEMLQAAAFALAWKKVQALPAVESFLYHRHVDHPHESGLKVGVRQHDGTPKVNGVGPVRMLWKVMQAAGTPAEDAAFAFALPVVGRSDWSGVVAAHLEPARLLKKEPGRILLDCVTRMDAAGRENVQAVEKKRMGPADEVPEPALLEHPKPTGIGRLHYKLHLPELDGSADRCAFVAELLLNHPKSNGASFSVEVNGQRLVERSLQAEERVPLEVDLQLWRGQDITLSLCVDALADPAYDWTTWVNPRVVLRQN